MAIVLDRELDILVRTTAQQNNLALTAVVRDALRWYFSLPQSTFDAGWREGYIAAYQAVIETVKRSISGVQSKMEAVMLPPQGGSQAQGGSQDGQDGFSGFPPGFPTGFPPDGQP